MQSSTMSYEHGDPENLREDSSNKMDEFSPSKKREERKKEKKKHKKKHHSRSRSREHKKHHKKRSHTPTEMDKKHRRKHSGSLSEDERLPHTRHSPPHRHSPPPRPKKKSRSPSLSPHHKKHKRHRSRSLSPRKHRSRSHSPKQRYRSRSRSPRRYSKSPPGRRGDGFFVPEPSPPLSLRRIEMTTEERDLRTVFVMQLAHKVHSRDLAEFFSSAGRVNDVRIIKDSKTKRSKGIAYVEFEEIEAVSKALTLNGKRLFGIPIIVQPSQAEKNRSSGSMFSYFTRPGTGPMRLYIGSLHFNVTETMLHEIFSPFGPIESIELLKDGETGRSRGYGFINFCDAEDAKRAMEHLNGYELAGRPIRVGHVTEKTEFVPPSHLDTDELDRNGIDLGPTGRLQLMAKLAEGTGLKIPQAALSALQMNNAPVVPVHDSNPPQATQCFMLSNMFERFGTKTPNWDAEIRNDVIEECRRHGGALHVHVDRNSPGNVYVKCPSIAAAVAAVKALHGRWFAGRLITAAYVPVINYHTLFTEAITATTPL